MFISRRRQHISEDDCQLNPQELLVLTHGEIDHEFVRKGAKAKMQECSNVVCGNPWERDGEKLIVQLNQTAMISGRDKAL